MEEFVQNLIKESPVLGVLFLLGCGIIFFLIVWIAGNITYYFFERSSRKWCKEMFGKYPEELYAEFRGHYKDRDKKKTPPQQNKSKMPSSAMALFFC